MTIAGYATGCERGYVYLRGEYPRARERLQHADRQRPRPRLARRRRDGPRVRLRHRDRARRRRLHLRRGDGDLQLDRGLPRRAAQQAAVPGRGRPVRQADASSTTSRRSSTCCRSCSTAARRSRRSGTGGSTGTKLFCVSGHVARPGVYEVPFGVTLRELLDAGGRRRRRPIAAGGAARRRGRHRSCGRRARHPAHVRRRAGARHHARLGRGHGARRHRRPAARSCAASPRSSATSRAGSACRAGSARCARRRRSIRLTDRRRGRPHDARPARATSAQAMRDASICGLGQTAWSAIESAIDRLGALS